MDPHVGAAAGTGGRAKLLLHQRVPPKRLLCGGCWDWTSRTLTDTEEEPLLVAAIFAGRGSHCGRLFFEACSMLLILRWFYIAFLDSEI